MNVLVAGGAGYIGSHCVRQLLAAGHTPIVVDNLSYGHRAAVDPSVQFHAVDFGDEAGLRRVFAAQPIDVVMHFGAFINVGESVTNPIKYYRNNVAAPLTLLEVMLEHGVRKFVFSSTCATYGVPQRMPMDENLPQAPINPYGQTKLDFEILLKALVRSHGLSFAAFRYFNAAGAAEDGTIGEDHDPETHLIPLAIGAALGTRPPLHILGNDYPTTDGTCLRDYIHVDDLSRAHIAVFSKLSAPGSQFFYNLGTGTPTSVLEVIQAVESVSGRKVPAHFAPRRAGDAPALYADPTKARDELGWTPRYTSIEPIIETAWRWHRDHPNGFADRKK